MSGAARELLPRRTWLQLSALAFFCFLAVVLRVGAMFHPRRFDAVTAVALLLAVRMLGRHDYRWQLAVATGVALGLGQLVRAFSLWTFAAVVLAFLVARAWRPPLVIVVATAIVTAPWYVRQAVNTATRCSTGREQEAIWKRRPACFYVGLGLPEWSRVRSGRTSQRGDPDDLQRDLGRLLRGLAWQS